MDFGKLLEKAWNTIWNNKFLILLGIIVVLGNAGTGGSSGGTSGFEWNLDRGDMPRFDFNFQDPFREIGLPVAAAGGILFIVLIALAVGLILWALSTIARGSLIYGANTLDAGENTTFSDSFQAGWQKGWRLIGISLVPALPALLLILVLFISLGLMGSMEALMEGQMIRPARMAFAPAVLFACVLLPLSLILSLMRTFANRACMLEDKGVFAAYRRGLDVLFNHFGNAFLLFLLQIAISIVLGLIFLIPSILSLLCCFLWPVALLVQGTFAAFYSTLWTLAWGEWTGPEQPEALSA